MASTKSVTIGAESNQSSYADPFTGGSRYIPGASTSDNAPDAIHSGADPFTGKRQHEIPQCPTLQLAK